MTTPLVRRLEALLYDALEPLQFDEPGQAASGRAQRLASDVLQREQAAGRIRSFRVSSNADEAPEGIVVDVAIVPPGPRVTTVAIRIVAPR